ncbi:hypothetical protein F4604DRAFT_1810856 [Suillus subluteus]|nr:hypothetical protein F4604DRAFT_1810856 [Suillus subluteus]
MLPRDTKLRKLDAAAEFQAQLDAHLTDKKPKDRIIPYSDALFRKAAIEWQIETDQFACRNGWLPLASVGNN